MSDEILVAIIGGIVTIIVGAVSGYAGYKGAVKGAQLQIQKQKNDDKDKKIQEELNTKKSIEIYLYEEIADNLELMKLSTINAFKEHSDGTLVGGYYISEFDFSYVMYEEIKNQLIKLSDKDYIANIIYVYKAFKRVNKIRKLHEMDQDEAKKLHTIFVMWIEKLDLKHLK